MASYPYRIRDPVHSFIHYDDRELSIINHPIFQRLRYIRQLALTYYIYPGATHTRFEHSLGVMELVSRAFDMIATKNKSKLEKNFNESGLDLRQAKEILRLTALLHDIGHLPFSHGAESVLPPGKKHEDVSLEVINNSDLTDIVDKLYGKEYRNYVSILLDPKKAPIPEFLILKKLIAGQIDLDRTDYLIRDSLHCGVYYGNFDYHRLLETINVIDGEEGGLDLAIDRGGVHCIEALLVARYFMFAQVYYHRTRRMYDFYLKKFMREFLGRRLAKKPLKKVLNYDDGDLLHNIKISALEPKGRPKNKWARHIFYRTNHHSNLFETSYNATDSDKKRAKGLLDELQKKFNGDKLFSDFDARGRIHNLYTGREGEERADDLQVLIRDREPRWIRDESDMIVKMPKRFEVIRIYFQGNPQEMDEAEKIARRYEDRKEVN